MSKDQVSEDRMADYDKQHVVGQGAFGTVYLCHRRLDNAEMIMKQIPLEDMNARDRDIAMREVKILDRLKHPNIIGLYDSFIHGASLCIIMEYAEGGTLCDYIQKRKARGRTISENKILYLFSQIAVSLSFIHSQRILHRDMKTSNIFLNKSLDIVKVGDFGISTILNTRSKAFSVIGTPSYISPELCENQPYNKKSDIWALGCVLYEMITLKRAFQALNLPALVKKILTGAVPPMTGKYSDDIKDLVTRLLNREPAKRPSIQEVLASPLLINRFMDLPVNIGRPKGIRAAAPTVGVALVPGKPRPGKDSLTSLSSLLEAEGLDHKHELPAVAYRWGSGILNPTTLPLPGKADVEIKQVAIGRTNSIGVTTKGRLINWETSISSDELPGARNKEENKISTIPKFIDCHTGVYISRVSCGDMFNACLTDAGMLMTFGSGANGCLGHGNLLDVKDPKIVETLIGEKVIKVSCGAMHVMAITADHSVFSWGKGDTGRLGHSNNETCNKPELVTLPDDTKALSCFCGTDCSVVLTHQNKVLACGGNRFNKLALIGDEDDTLIDEIDHLVPVRVKPVVDLCVKEVAFGVSHSAFLTENGNCYTCGSNSFGQLGFPKSGSNHRPCLVKSLEEKVIIHVACGDTFTVAVTADNEIYTWGKGARGRLGSGDEENKSKPMLVKFQEKSRVISISANRGTTVAVTKEVFS